MLRVCDGQGHDMIGYDKQRYAEAIANGELSVEQEPGFPIPWRNLGIAYYYMRHDPDKAIICYEKAFQANSRDGRVFSKLNQLLRRTGTPAEVRLARLEDRLDLVRQRDDLSVELATLHNQTGQPQEVLDYPWADAHLDYFAGLAIEALGDSDGATVSFQRMLASKPDLSDMAYYQALALQAL